MGDFRRDFDKLSDDALVNALELAELLSTDRSCLYGELRKGRIVKPVIHRQRQIRWRAGDIRDWLRSLGSAPALVRVGYVRMGRMRKGGEVTGASQIPSQVCKDKPKDQS